MVLSERPFSRRVLLADDDVAIREMMKATLGEQGFEVVSTSSVIEALKFITTETFDVLITDLHMPNPGDGFTLVTAMRHSQPAALILLVSGYPDVQSAMATILLEPDEIILKPFDGRNLAELLSRKVLARKPAAQVRKERVAAILLRSIDSIVEAWLVRSKQIDELNNLLLSDTQRTGHLPKLIEDLAFRLSTGIAGITGISGITGGDAIDSPSASAHGELRYRQGYRPTMLVQESRMLQVTIFETLQSNRNLLDFSLLLPDVMTIADEVDFQLTQAMSSYMDIMEKEKVA